MSAPTPVEEDHVILHCHQIWPDGLKCAGIDIFRLDATGRSSSTGTFFRKFQQTARMKTACFDLTVLTAVHGTSKGPDG